MHLRSAIGLIASLACAAAVQAQPAYRVKDMSPGPGYGSSPQEFVELNGVVYFNATDAAHGAELWRTDGTAGGTRLVHDIVPGPVSSNPSYFMVAGNRLYFQAYPGLWQSDGTPAGTVRVAPHLAQTVGLLAVGDTLFFGGADLNGMALWRTDGTPQGIVRVKTMYPAAMAAVGSTLYVVASGNFGYELWKSDGTEAGTVRVRMFEPGFFGTFPAWMTAMGGALYFTVPTAAAGRELWRSDGTEAGTVMVKDIHQGPLDSLPMRLTVLGSTLYFAADDGLTGNELWKSDGTAAGTVRVRDIWPGALGSEADRLTTAGGVLYFAANDGVNGGEVWRSDGTEAGTTLVGAVTHDAFYGPQELTEFGGALYFMTDDGTHGMELWRTDGGTPQILDLRPGPLGSRPTSIRSAAGRLYFGATPEPFGLDYSGDPWSSDGTLGGSGLIATLNPTASSRVTLGAGLHDAVLFGADGPAPGLWRSDGTEAGTYRLLDPSRSPHGTTGDGFAVLNGLAYFMAYDAGGAVALWRSDGSIAGTSVVTNQIGTNAYDLVATDNLLYFTAESGFLNRELWKSDGTAAGTGLVTEIHPGGGSYPFGLTPAGSLLYFTANDGTEGYELWKTDGTQAGTVRISAIGPGLENGGVGQITPADGQLFFTARDATHGAELWKTDGTLAGTMLVRDIYPGYDSSPYQLVAIGSGVFFVAAGPGSGVELWHSDGTEAGTAIVRDIWPGPRSSNIVESRRVGDLLFFSADDGVIGNEPWRSDGTAAGTYPLADLWPGPDSSMDWPQVTARWGGHLFFTAGTPTSGQELWRTDGTVAGTAMVQEIGPGHLSAGIEDEPLPGAGLLFFQAADEAGVELWALRPELRIADTTGGEEMPATLGVSLVPALDRPVTVSFATADGSATAGADYTSTAGALTFAPGVVQQPVAVPVLDDALDEPDESFFVDLSNAAGAYVSGPRGEARIVDNEPTPELAVADVTQTEGGPGNTTALVTVTATGASSLPIEVSYYTADGTAIDGVDYVAAAGVLILPPGTTSITVPVTIIGDLADEPDERFFFTLWAASQAVLADPVATCVIRDDDGGTIPLSELAHGNDRVADLAAQPGPLADSDLYLLLREPGSSFEVVVDAASGDLGDAGPILERIAPDLTTVLQASSPVGTGHARSLRLTNNGGVTLLDYVRVRSAGCSTGCGPDDTYRIRVRETTGRIPRFNEVGSQRTLVVLQNTSDAPIAARVSYWSAAGSALAVAPVTLGPRATIVLPTPAGSQGTSGSITVSHDGPHGALAGKAVAVDPIGLSFDTPMTPRPD